MLGSLNNWIIIKFTNKTTSKEGFDSFIKTVLDIISDNMASLVQLCKYGAINEAGPTTMGYYVIKYPYEPYIAQEDQTTDGPVSKAGEILVKAEYLSLMRAKILVLETAWNLSECHNINLYHCSSMCRGSSY